MIVWTSSAQPTLSSSALFSLLSSAVNQVLTIQAALAYAPRYLAKESRGVRVIQTFFKLQFIFPEL